MNTIALTHYLTPINTRALLAKLGITHQKLQDATRPKGMRKGRITISASRDFKVKGIGFADNFIFEFFETLVFQFLTISLVATTLNALE